MTAEIWSFVGAGGKTTSIFQIARQMCEKGLRVLITTTTHMAAGDRGLCRMESALELLTDVSGRGALIAERMAPGRAVLAGCLLTERDRMDARGGKQECSGRDVAASDKIGPLPEQEFRSAAEAADVVLVEADGSRRMPFKAPGEREPVPHEKSNRIFIIAGLSALGFPVCRACHRPKLVCEITGRPETSVLTTRDMACVLYHGYIRPMRLKFPGAPLTVLLNQADGPERQEAGRDAGCRLKSLLGSGEAPVEIRLNSWAGPLKGERL